MQQNTEYRMQLWIHSTQRKQNIDNRHITFIQNKSQIQYIAETNDNKLHSALNSKIFTNKNANYNGVRKMSFLRGTTAKAPRPSHTCIWINALIIIGLFVMHDFKSLEHHHNHSTMIRSANRSTILCNMKFVLLVESFSFRYPSSSSSTRRIHISPLRRQHQQIKQDIPSFPGYTSIRFNLDSTASSDNDQKEVSSNNDYISKYPTLQSLNNALQNIVNECSHDTRKVNFDIISRASAAEALVQQIESNSNDMPYQPNEATYILILKIWAKAAHVLAEGSGRGDINEVYHALDDIPIPQELMDAFDHIVSARDAAEHANSILTSMEVKYLTGESDVKPTCRGYNTVMDGWNKSRARDASEHIQSLFLNMQTWSSAGVAKHSSINDGVELIHGDAEYWSGIKPNAITHSITIESFGSKASDSEIVGNVDELLAALEREFEETQDANFKPDIGVANSLIKSYLRSAQYSSGGGGRYQQSLVNTSWKTAKKINEIYNKWYKKYKTTGDLDFKPTVATVNMVIDAYSRCGDVGATERAQQVFDSMIKDWEATKDDRSKPMSKTFAVMISAWAKSRDPRCAEKGEELIHMMEQFYEEDKVENGAASQLFPLSKAYTAAINAWARSNDNTKPKRSLKLLKKVIDMYKETKDKRIQPSLYTFNAAIDACAKCHGTAEQQTEALKIAFAVNKAIAASKLQANHVTYTTLLKTVNSLLDPGKEKSDIITAVFSKCKQDGYVDHTVLKTLKMSCDQGLFLELLDEARGRSGYVEFDLIPSQWCRNIKN